MTKKESLQLFEEKKVRTVWDDKEEKWYFSIADAYLQDLLHIISFYKKEYDYTHIYALLKQ